MDTEYYKNKSAPDGHNPYCKECTKKRSSKWIKENPERYKEIRSETNKKLRTKLLTRINGEKHRKLGNRKTWQRNNPDKLYQYGLDRKINKTHEISNEEWEQCLNYFYHSCAYCGISETVAIAVYGQKLHKEHVDPNGANDLSNNIPACKSCNSKKHDKNFEEWYREDNELYEYYSFEREQKIHKWLKEDYLI